YAPMTDTAGEAVTEAPTDTLLKLLAMPSIRSKEDVIRKYDHEVGSGTAVKPLVGVDNHAPSDAAVIAPLDTVRMGSKKAVALSNGLAPLYGEIDPYAMAWASIDEAMRNIVAVGADPDQVAILDNFSWGNTQLPDRLGSLVRCLQGCYSASLAYGTPFISGKDSLNNEYVGEDGQRHAIPGTLVISAVGIVPDVEKTCTMDLKSADNRLYLIGQTWREFGGSHYALLHGQAGGKAPQPAKNPLETLRKLHVAIQ
ncbi:MAG TPA: AIR synthase related protein, partial [Aggregatilineales bacterium]|nr:AIR synthase related protein [Aggregatilineales bacterium]